LTFIETLTEGTYVLRRALHDTRVECLRAVAPECAAAQQPRDVPQAHDLRPGATAAGAADAAKLDFIPIRWQVGLRRRARCSLACDTSS
jgi:hypothetical protein